MKKQKSITTGFLFSTPSFLTGFGSVINLAGNFYEFNSSKSGFEADQMAIQNDFDMIAQDLHDVLNKVNFDNHQLLTSE